MKTLNREEAIEALKAGKKIAPAGATLPGVVYIEWGGNPFYPVTTGYDGATCHPCFFREHELWRIYEPEPELMSLIDAYEAAKPGQVLKRRNMEGYWSSGYVIPCSSTDALVWRLRGEKGNLIVKDLQATDWYVTYPS